MNPQIDMNELDLEAQKKVYKRLEIYNKILKDCHNKIRFNSKLDRKYCFFLIPEFIFGTPLYDIEELRDHVIKSLEKNSQTKIYRKLFLPFFFYIFFKLCFSLFLMNVFSVQ